MAMDWIDEIVRDLCEIPDRNSPEDAPDMMLVKPHEIRNAIERALIERDDHPGNADLQETKQRCHTTRTGLPYVDELLERAGNAIGSLLAINKGLANLEHFGSLNEQRWITVRELSTIAPKSMTEAQRAAWGRLMKGGWFTGDLEKMLDDLTPHKAETFDRGFQRNENNEGDLVCN